MKDDKQREDHNLRKLLEEKWLNKLVKGYGQVSNPLQLFITLVAFLCCIGNAEVTVAADRIFGSLIGAPTYNRIFTSAVDPNCNATCSFSTSGVGIPYAVIPIFTTTGGNLVAEVKSAGTDIADTTISLYCDPFDACDASQHLIAYDDDDGDGLLSAFFDADGAYLSPDNQYFLVLSLFQPSSIGGGNYQIDFGGSVRIGYSLTGPTTTISPSSGDYCTTQGFDLVIILPSTGSSIVDFSATLDCNNVTAILKKKAIDGQLVSGGRTFRVPGLIWGDFGPGLHTFSIVFTLSGGATVSDSVLWNVLENTEP